MPQHFSVFAWKGSSQGSLGRPRQVKPANLNCPQDAGGVVADVFVDRGGGAVVVGQVADRALAVGQGPHHLAVVTGLGQIGG